MTIQVPTFGLRSKLRKCKARERQGKRRCRMTQDLFRKEVLESKRRGWLGSISLAQPLHLWSLTVAAVLAATVIALFLMMGSYTRRSSVTGQLVPSMGLSTALAPATGVVSRLDVGEGDPVIQGQVLAVVTMPRATVVDGDTLSALAQRLERRRAGLIDEQAARHDLIAAEEQGFRAQLASARRELDHIETEVATRQAQIRIAKEVLDRLRQLEGERYVSVLQIKQQESAALSWTAEEQGLRRQAIATRRDIVQIEQALQDLPAHEQASKASHARELALLEQEQVETQARGALTINSTYSGVVSALLVKSGQTVQAGQPLLSLLPSDARLEAELLVPSRAIGFIKSGDRVLLRYQSYPYQKFGHQEGRVARISRSALNDGEVGALVNRAQAGEPVYRVTVALERQAVMAYGKEEQLKPGMLVDADVLGERRRLIEWIFEPLYSLNGKVGSS